uniref:Transmembrane protein 65 n=1 Tax=Rhabditophanes sp. KR3021 TaxID=114890 RepID=A0AC35TKH5_9BILA
MTLLLRSNLIKNNELLRIVRKSYSLSVNNSRNSTTAACKLLENLRVQDEVEAKNLALHFDANERKLLIKAFQEEDKEDARQRENPTGNPRIFISKEDTKKLFLFNGLPFVGFGLFDNMIMILAGEYIDQQLGMIFTLSTMAAAALGNTISDIAGIGLAHYVENFVSRFGIRHPELTAEALNSKKSRYIVNAARAIGLVIGCTIGMFPLLFFDKH